MDCSLYEYLFILFAFHRTNTEQYLLDLTRDNVQLLINEIWELPTERVEEQVVAKLPAPKLPLPRSRKLPEPKALTKWEQFAKEKGIKKRVKDKKVYDDVLDVSSILNQILYTH